MRTRTLAAGILLLTLFLLPAACGEAVTEIPGIRPTSTKTKIPTLTPRMNLTPHMTFTRDVEFHQTWEAEVVATENALQTVVAPYPGNCGAFYGFLVSPDGNWLASDCYNTDKFLVLNRDGSERWSITYQEVLEPYINYSGSIEVSGIGPHHWSTDSRYIYFFTYFLPSPDIIPDYMPFDMSPLAHPLYRLNTENGFWAQITPPANYYSFSPTDRRLAYISKKNWNCEIDICSVNISVLDLKNGDVIDYSLSNTAAAAHIVWSEDGTKFFFAAVKAPSVEYQLNYSIYMVDIISGSINILQTYESARAIIYPINVTNNELVIQIRNIDNNYQSSLEYQYFDLATNQLISLTPTP